MRNERCLALFRSIWALANLVDPSSFRFGIDKLVPQAQHVNLRRVAVPPAQLQNNSDKRFGRVWRGSYSFALGGFW